jgi:hypothetical protein
VSFRGDYKLFKSSLNVQNGQSLIEIQWFQKGTKNLLQTRHQSQGEHTVLADPDAIGHDGSLKNGTQVYFTPKKKNRKSNGGLTSQYWPRTIITCVMPIQAWNAVDAMNWAQIQNPCSSATPELIKTALLST